MFSCVAATRFGFTGLVSRELKQLGFNPAPQGDYVGFEADAAGLARACLWLRTADRIQVLVGEFMADSFDALYDGIKAIRWKDMLPRDALVPVEARCVKSTLMSPSDCQSIAKKAIVDAMGQVRLPETGPRHQVEVSIRGNRVLVLLDTCGAGLHKRGYRELTGDAPIMETLAAGVLLFSKWHPELALMDPMCGTGTFLIEAALMAENRAPGLNRPFDAQFWPMVGGAAFGLAKEAARGAIRPYDGMLRGTDIDESALSTARTCAERAGVSGIHFQRIELSDSAWRKQNKGMLVTNPPYGKRLMDKEHVQKLYRRLGQFWGELPGCSAHIFTAFPDFERFFGRKAVSTQKLYNGPLLCRLYHYDAETPRPR